MFQGWSTKEIISPLTEKSPSSAPNSQRSLCWSCSFLLTLSFPHPCPAIPFLQTTYSSLTGVSFGPSTHPFASILRTVPQALASSHPSGEEEHRAAAPNFPSHLPPTTLLSLLRTTNVAPSQDQGSRNATVTVLFRQCRCPWALLPRAQMTSTDVEIKPFRS